MRKDERVTVFIDGANLFFTLKDDFENLNLDFNLLAHKLVDDRRLVRTYYYTALPDQRLHPDRYAKQMRFLDALREKPYFTVILGRLESRGNTYVEKGVDIALAVDMLQMAYSDAYDTAILVSGDGDLSKVVEIVQRMGKHVENASTPSCLSYHLRNVCDKTVILNKDFLKNCWRK